MATFHPRLNARLWDGDELHPKVRLHLLKAAKAFYLFLDVPDLKLEDVVLTGSNCGFAYTPISDIDLHLVVDPTKTVCPTLADDFFQTKKSLWNATHDIFIHGHVVELYVENEGQPAFSNGRFSIVRNRWLSRPTREVPTVDDAAVARKTEALAADIEAILSGSPDMTELEELANRIWSMRASGLMAGGEFSVENLAFKSLRSQGLLRRLQDARTTTLDRSLSL
jgi:hypothetical protein